MGESLRVWGWGFGDQGSLGGPPGGGRKRLILDDCQGLVQVPLPWSPPWFLSLISDLVPTPGPCPGFYSWSLPWSLYPGPCPGPYPWSLPPQALRTGLLGEVEGYRG